MATQLSSVTSEYALGYTAAEQERLIRQATLIAPITERLFREAGIGPGQRVLDLGSGVGDVSILVARLVGPSGEVVGIERDTNSIARAQERVAAAGLRNVNFVCGDLTEITQDGRFDAAVGRFILMFLPDPGAVLRSVVRLVRPFGVLAFQEPSWVGMLTMASPLPLWSRVLGSIHETFRRSGVNPEMGIDLHRRFQEVGLPAPHMHLDTPLGADVSLTSIMCDLLRSVRPLAEQHNKDLAHLGSFETLSKRVEAEIKHANTAVGFIPIVSAWARKVMD